MCVLSFSCKKSIQENWTFTICAFHCQKSVGDVPILYRTMDRSGFDDKTVVVTIT